jgi:structural maintenance of chromosome 3 (chondroitin sulfate proteoglycan 6)
LTQLQTELEHLSAKQGRHDKFNNATERDSWISTTIKDLQRALQESTTQLESMNQEYQKTGDSVTELETDLVALKDRLSGRRALLDKLKQDFETCKNEKDTLEAERKNLWRDEATLNFKLDTLKQKVDKHRRDLMATVDRNTSKGLSSVERIVKRLEIDGYYGPLYGLFQVEEAFQTAVDVIGGSSLFHLVVDSDQTASRILEELNKERGGRVTFMPLNRLKPKQPTYPSNEDALPLISRLEYDQKFHPAMLQVFGKAILAASLEEASIFARSHHLTGITLEGDRADRKGALSGGFNDFNKSRLEVVSQLKESTEALDNEIGKVDVIKLRLMTLDREILKLRDRAGEIDTKKRAVVTSREPIEKEISVKTQKLEQLVEFKTSEERSIESLKAQIEEIKEKIGSAEREIGTPFQKKLNANETSRLAELPELVQNCRSGLSDLVNQRVDVII